MTVSTTDQTAEVVRVPRLAYDQMPDFYDRRHEYEADREAGHVELADAWPNPERSSARFLWFRLSPQAARALYEEMDWERTQLTWQADAGDLYKGEAAALRSLTRWVSSNGHLKTA